jgi:hypothetical protein
LGTKEEFAALLYVLVLVAHLLSKWRRRVIAYTRLWNVFNLKKG